MTQHPQHPHTDPAGGRDRVFPGQSEMAARMRALDWSRTPVGPVETWPQNLRSTVKTLLVSRYPMVLTWGPEFTQFYNDAYSELIGDRHPAALGNDIRITLAEGWDVLGPMIDEVMRSGVANWTPALPLLLVRSGYREEAYFSVSHAPAEDDDGRIVGMLAVCSEVTRQVLGERRTRLLRDLALKAGETLNLEQTCRDIAAAVAEHPLDVPFALLYLRDPDGGTLTLRGIVGLSEDGAASPRSIDLAPGAERVWSLPEGAGVERAAVVEDVERRVRLTGGLWNDPVTTALVMPVGATGQLAAQGMLVAAVSPNRALDEGYRSFYELLAGQVSVAVRNASAYEEERRRAEELAELDRAKTTFFSNVSHEFRTPLTLMLGPLEDVLASRGGALPREVRAELEVVHRNALRLLRLVNTLLDFSRIEAGRLQATYEPTDLAVLTAELASTFRSAVERAGLRLVVDTPPLPEPVHVDREMWEKVVLNLLSNALKHTFHGEIAVRLRVAERGVELEVRDTGTGIPADQLPHVFERFHRVQGARSRTHEGTGIGLALVQELVRLHGGEVRVESEVDAGSRFVVTIPLGMAHLPAGWAGASSAPPSTAASARPFVEESLRWLPAGPEAGGEAAAADDGEGATVPRGARILLADDNADMRGYLARLLGEHFQVDAVADGTAALARTREWVPDLVLSDVMMPGLDGFALLRELRADPRTRAVPVILLSARAGEEATLEGLDAGADDYLVKPFSARELLTRVMTHLRMARIRQGAEERERLLGELQAVNTELQNQALQLEETQAELEMANDELRESNESLSAEMRAAEHARAAADEANRAKSEFLATMSHELRTPLNATIGYADLLLLGIPDPLTEASRAQVQRIRTSSMHLLRLIDEVLTFSRVEAGREEVHAERVDTGEMVREAADLMEPIARATGLALRTHVPEAPIHLRTDPGKLSQILFNLLSNAIKFTEEGSVELRVTRRGPDVAFEVCDTGIGIAPEHRERIFEPFRQVEQGHTRRQGGTGLGLSISRQLAHVLGGDVEVESAPGHGSTFTLRLPLAAGEGA